MRASSAQLFWDRRVGFCLFGEGESGFTLYQILTARSASSALGGPILLRGIGPNFLCDSICTCSHYSRTSSRPDRGGAAIPRSVLSDHATHPRPSSRRERV